MKGQEPETPGRGAAVSEPMPWFSEPETGRFAIAVEQATDRIRGRTAPDGRRRDKLVAAVMQRLAEGFANERSGLEKQWDSGDNVSTEDLRVALQRYRSFFDRLLKL